MDQEKVQEKYVEVKMMNEQLQEAHAHLQRMEQHLAELAGTIEALDDIKNSEKGSELFVPISSGIFAKAKLEETSNVNINVGAGVAVSKTVEQAKEMVEKQFKDLEQFRSRLMMQIHILANKMQEAQKELQGMVG